MAEQQPNDPSRGSGREQFDQSDTEQSGISNRPLDEGTTNQESVPPRGESKPGADRTTGYRRPTLDTPRRYDQPIEDDEDPVMPADDATVNTKI